MRGVRASVLMILLITWAALAGAAPEGGERAAFDVNPWLEDLHQIKDAFSAKYANFEWAVFEREINLADLFATTEARLRQAAARRVDEELERIFIERCAGRDFKWPAVIYRAANDDKCGAAFGASRPHK